MTTQKTTELDAVRRAWLTHSWIKQADGDLECTRCGAFCLAAAPLTVLKGDIADLFSREPLEEWTTELATCEDEVIRQILDK